MFIDDFYRMTWAYLVKDRPQVVNIIQSFFKEIKTLFSKPLRIFRTNNAHEYVQHDISLLCES